MDTFKRREPVRRREITSTETFRAGYARPSVTCTLSVHEYSMLDRS
jgi:hypothetical protein